MSETTHFCDGMNNTYLSPTSSTTEQRHGSTHGAPPAPSAPLVPFANGEPTFLPMYPTHGLPTWEPIPLPLPHDNTHATCNLANLANPPSTEFVTAPLTTGASFPESNLRYSLNEGLETLPSPPASASYAPLHVSNPNEEGSMYPFMNATPGPLVVSDTANANTHAVMSYGTGSDGGYNPFAWGGHSPSTTVGQSPYTDEGYYNAYMYPNMSHADLNDGFLPTGQGTGHGSDHNTQPTRSRRDRSYATGQPSLPNSPFSLGDLSFTPSWPSPATQPRRSTWSLSPMLRPLSTVSSMRRMRRSRSRSPPRSPRPQSPRRQSPPPPPPPLSSSWSLLSSLPSSSLNRERVEDQDNDNSNNDNNDNNNSSSNNNNNNNNNNNDNDDDADWISMAFKYPGFIPGLIPREPLMQELEKMMSSPFAGGGGVTSPYVESFRHAFQPHEPTGRESTGQEFKDSKEPTGKESTAQAVQAAAQGGPQAQCKRPTGKRSPGKMFAGKGSKGLNVPKQPMAKKKPMVNKEPKEHSGSKELRSPSSKDQSQGTRPKEPKLPPQ